MFSTLSTPLSSLAASLLGSESSPAALAAEARISPANPSQSPRIDTPKMVFELVMRGIAPDEVTEITGLTTSEVEKILLSQWFESETQQRAKHANHEEPESLRSLLRVQAFRATVKLGQLLNSTNQNVQLGAIKTCLEYTIKPMRLIDIDKSNGVGSPEDVQRETKDLERKLALLERRAR